MWFSSLAFILSVSTSVLAHGAVRYVSIDGRFYWGYSPERVFPNNGRDDRLDGKGVIFGYNQIGSTRLAIVNQTSPDMACNRVSKAPALIAPARAGSEVKFMWNPWYISHKGPLLTYLAPYEGQIEHVNLNELEFFKISERGLGPDNRTWATDEMIANGNVTSAVIPHDIKSGKYILRHELISLHYATEDSLYGLHPEKPLGPQHYIQCFNVHIEGPGTAQPGGVTFPGAYRPFRHEPGLYFDVWRNVHPYPVPGPALYVPQGPAPQLKRRSYDTIQSPTGDSEMDMRYFGALTQDILQWDGFTVNVANAERRGYGHNPNMTGPPEGSVPGGATVGGT